MLIFCSMKPCAQKRKQKQLILFDLGNSERLTSRKRKMAGRSLGVNVKQPLHTCSYTMNHMRGCTSNMQDEAHQPRLCSKMGSLSQAQFFRSTPEKWWRNQFTAEEPPIHAFYWRLLACVRKEFTAHEPPNINVLSEDGLNTAVGSVFD
jgi:hypothetical protein